MGAKNSKPYWHRDEDHPECEMCGVGFSVSVRKHHCRNCGAVCCNKCSFRKVAVQARGIKEPVRVCESCYVSIVTHSSNANKNKGAGGDSGNGQGNANATGRPQSPSQMNGTQFPSSSSPIPDVEPPAVTAAAAAEEEQNLYKQILGSVLFADVNEVAVDPPSLTEDVRDTTYEPRMSAADPDFEIGLPCGANDALDLLMVDHVPSLAESSGPSPDQEGEDVNDDEGGASDAAQSSGPVVVDTAGVAAAMQQILPIGNDPAEPFLAPFEAVDGGDASLEPGTME